MDVDGTKVVTITLEPNVGPMVVLDLPLIQRLELSLKSLPPGPTGLILASGSDRVFVAGADLKSIDAMSKDELERYLAYGQQVFGMICALPCPTVAAINGAALGGGLELAMHCDGLVAAPAPVRDGQPGKPYPIGLPEAGLSICPGWGGTNLMPARIRDAADAISRTCAGKTMNIEEAAACGLIDRMAESPAALLGAAKSWLVDNRNAPGRRRDGRPLRWIGRDSCRNTVTQAYSALQAELSKADPAAACMKAIGAGLETGWPAALEIERKELNRLRNTAAGKAAIRAFLDKSKK